jgi:hypothetical protein
MRMVWLSLQHLISPFLMGSVVNSSLWLPLIYLYRDVPGDLNAEIASALQFSGIAESQPVHLDGQVVLLLLLADLEQEHYYNI